MANKPIVTTDKVAQTIPLVPAKEQARHTVKAEVVLTFEGDSFNRTMAEQSIRDAVQSVSVEGNSSGAKIVGSRVTILSATT